METYTIITTDANALVGDLHNRMPVILGPRDYASCWMRTLNMNVFHFPNRILMACTITLILVIGSSMPESAFAETVAVWGPAKRGGCTKEGLRNISAPLFNVPDRSDPKAICDVTPRNVMGILAHPDRCSTERLPWGRNEGAIERGEWDVPDTSCLSTPPAQPKRGPDGLLASSGRLEGYADIHVHQMGYLGFGGSVLWGRAFGNPSEALRSIPSEMRRGHDITQLAVTGQYAPFAVDTLIADLFNHREEGYPTFLDWPRYDNVVHQQAYEDWLFRAYQGGLRLMVMLAENSEDMFGRGENSMPVLSRHKFQPIKAAGRSGNDMEALEWQVREAYKMQDHIDAKFSGHGKGWYRIVRDPDEASKVISEGRLAVILGTELQHLFNCDMDRPACTEETIIEGLNRLEGMGVNYVFPLHHKLNQFGGPAQFQPLNNGPTEDCPESDRKCSAVGLTPLGRILVKELMARGMLIDTEHMSWKAFKDTMDIVDQENYPVLAGHVEPYNLKVDGQPQNERTRTADQLRRILKSGGIVAPILDTEVQEYAGSKSASARVPISCARDGGGADQWANAYLFVRGLAPSKGLSGGDGHIAIGSDWNGFANWPHAQYVGDARSCSSWDRRRTKYGEEFPPEPHVSYPFSVPKELVPLPKEVQDVIHGTSLDSFDDKGRMKLFDWPSGRQWDYNNVGLSHVGLMPDFLEDLRLVGLTESDLEPIYRSARGVVDLWKTARSLGRGSLRWVPHNPFDVLDNQTIRESDYWDSTRNVQVRPGSPVCRSRNAHKLGFERGNECDLVEQTNVAQDARPTTGTISAYHSGRCLAIANSSLEPGARALQWHCNSNASQMWQVRAWDSASHEIVNANSGKCLAISGGLNAEDVTVTQQECNGHDDQKWLLQRIGNTFELRAQRSGKCLEVLNESRDDGAIVQPVICSGAANQLWSIDALRRNDFERLYQADKGRYDWLDHDVKPGAVGMTVDGIRSICRSHDSVGWLGQVVGTVCVGKTYDGTSVTTSQFEELYEIR